MRVSLHSQSISQSRLGPKASCYSRIYSSDYSPTNSLYIDCTCLVITHAQVPSALPGSCGCGMSGVALSVAKPNKAKVSGRAQLHPHARKLTADSACRKEEKCNHTSATDSGIVMRAGSWASPAFLLTKCLSARTPYGCGSPPPDLLLPKSQPDPLVED